MTIPDLEETSRQLIDAPKMEEAGEEEPARFDWKPTLLVLAFVGAVLLGLAWL